ncbi:MAG: phosphoribosylanthranilate isomerase [Bacteroidaceae bacterium]|nr:phosphoribosylanthranilate isomerase [Bacteroidaceae bacterium]
MIVKVCGMRDPENIRQVDTLEGLNWMGFIFYPPSSRNVKGVPDYLPQHCKRVGVFVNATQEEILRRQKEFSFDLIQLHGDETPLFCKNLRSLLPAKTQLIKMIPITSAEELAHTQPYENVVDYFLFETKCQGYGGSGQRFDWDILQHYHGQTPFLLTGGIKSTNSEKVRAFHHPQFVGIDLNSGFEIAPALKDPQRIQAFIHQIIH